jgi:hypothetical protein
MLNGIMPYRREDVKELIEMESKNSERRKDSAKQDSTEVKLWEKEVVEEGGIK